MCNYTKYTAVDTTITKGCECGYRFPLRVKLDLAKIKSQTLLKALWELGEDKRKNEARQVQAN